MTFILLFLFLTGCAVWDLRTGRISNRWVLLWCVLLGACAVYLGGGRGAPAVDYLMGLCFTGVILFPLFLFRMIGAGDIKMMSLIGGTLGIHSGFTVIFYGLAASALWSLLYMARKRILLKRFAYFLNYMKVLSWMEQIPPYYCAERDGREPVFCLAPFILLGFVIWMAVGGGTI